MSKFKHLIKKLLHTIIFLSYKNKRTYPEIGYVPYTYLKLTPIIKLYFELL